MKNGDLENPKAHRPVNEDQEMQPSLWIVCELQFSPSECERVPEISRQPPDALAESSGILKGHRRLLVGVGASTAGKASGSAPRHSAAKLRLSLRMSPDWAGVALAWTDGGVPSSGEQ